MTLLITCAFWLIVPGAIALAARFWIHMRTLGANSKRSGAADVDPARYRPMLRLLSLEDTEMVTDPGMRRKLRRQRRDIFRGYLRSLTGDYGKLLGELRMIITQSSVERADLAKALVRNQVLFSIALCRIDFQLSLYALGIGEAESVKLQVRGLVDSLNVLRGQFNLVESAVWGG